ncbi:beta-1,6-N-acetylglucosaminyltransferase, WSC domain-containing protein-containing protein [Scheffersomyces amazonensis]|uniref:beta-1,6-N-acetylglucosaminyltransferase, WSC domain-containing protein-containing protein n=1 Tax=Scheffersomyces amazonensis TaxID=1078765 RepID=UPI00315C584E
MKFQTIATLAFTSTALASYIEQGRIYNDENAVVIGNDFEGFEIINLKENDEQILKKTSSFAVSSSSTTTKAKKTTTAVSSSSTSTKKSKETSSTEVSSSKKHKSQTASITKTNDGAQVGAAGAIVAGPIAIIAGLLL